MDFEPREVGSAEQLMLNRMPDGRMVTTHSWAAVVDGLLEPAELERAMQWAIARHPMLRACVETPPPPGNDTGPFIHFGKDGRFFWKPSPLTVGQIAAKALQVVELTDAQVANFEDTWRLELEASLDRAFFDYDNGPLWRVKLMRSAAVSPPQTVLVFCFVHALDDQRSGNILLHDLLSFVAATRRGESPAPPEPLQLPRSIEEAILKEEMDPWRLARYGLLQIANGAQSNVILPSSLRSKERGVLKHWAYNQQQPTASLRPLLVPTEPAEGVTKYLMSESVDSSSDFFVQRRRNQIALRRVPSDVLKELRARCRENNVTVSMAIASAVLLALSDVSHDELDFGYEVYRLLLSADMRRYAQDGDWTGQTVAYAAGALDFTTRVLPGSATEFIKELQDKTRTTSLGGVPFWELARAAADFTEKWIQNGYAEESVRMFDLGTRMLRMESIIYANAQATTLGRAYSVTVSNAGLYNQSNGDYGSLKLKEIFFGISQAVTGSLCSLSCLTVAGALQLTAIASTPILTRAALDVFADMLVKTLTMAAQAPAKPKSSGGPRVDYPVEVRGGMPAVYPLETPKGSLRCPQYEDIRSSYMPVFEVDKYVGVWYELAFHDITQFNGCGCTQFNMTRNDLIIEDMFTVTCPWPWRNEVEGPWLPGYNKVNGNRQGNQWTCNMTMYISPQQPGVMKETGFSQEFDNMVLEVWRDPEMQKETGYEYTRSLQFQCLADETGDITFTGINFLSRKPIISEPMLQEMFVRARALGLEPYGSNDMHIVEHRGCRYPKSTDRTWMGDRPEWPFPIFDKEWGAAV